LWPLAERIRLLTGDFAYGRRRTVLLLSANAQWDFASRVQGLARSVRIQLALFFFIYLLMRSKTTRFS